MHKPKLSKTAYARLVETGVADDYLTAHAEWAPTYAPGSDVPRYDVILDAEASNELFQEFSKGKLSLQDASQQELQAFLEEISCQNQCSGDQGIVNPWKSFAVRAALIITGLVLFIFAIVLLTR